VLTSFAAPSTPRGIYELGNGNIMWTNGNGVNIYDVSTSTSSLVFAGACYHLNLYGGPAASTAAYGTGCDGLVLAANGLPRVGRGGFALLLNNVPVVSPIGLFGFGTIAVNPGIDLTFLGMAGCYAYSNIDLGLFSGSPVVGGTSTMPLPIPADLSLTGTTLSAQGLSFSLLTSFNLASSNGLSVVLGN